MDAGKLRHRVQFQEQIQTQDSAGDMIITWQNTQKAWAAIEPVSGREFMASATTQHVITARITIRYLSDIVVSWRGVHGGKFYNLHAILADKDSGLEYQTLMVSEGVNQGD